MAKITVICPKCMAQYSVNETHVGKTGQCKKCSTTFVLEEPKKADLETTLEPGERQALRETTSRSPAENGAAEIWNVGDVILDVYEVKEYFGVDYHQVVYEGQQGWVAGNFVSEAEPSCP